jgi:hypothetical protein
MMYFYLFVHRHVSASNPTIFRVMLQDCMCSLMCHHHSITLKIRMILIEIINKIKMHHNIKVHKLADCTFYKSH